MLLLLSNANFQDRACPKKWGKLNLKQSLVWNTTCWAFLRNRGNFSPPGFAQVSPVSVLCLSLLVTSQVSILNAPCQHGLGVTDGADSTQLDFLESRLLLQSWQLRQISL